MKITIPKHIEIKISCLFLILLILAFFIPIQHKVHCQYLLHLEECPKEHTFLGFFVGIHLFEVFFQILILEWYPLLYPHIYIILFEFIFGILASNFLINTLLRTRFAKFTNAFLRREFLLRINLIPNKQTLLNVFLLIFSILICVIILEVFTRSYLPQGVQLKGEFSQESLNPVMPDDIIGWINKPNYSLMKTGENAYIVKSNHNSLGLRSETELINKTKKRILLIGDSFIYGEGLDQNETLDYFLKKELNDTYEVINSGVSGYYTLQEYMLLKRSYDATKPDFVAVSIFYNDLRHNIFPSLSGTKKPYVSLNSDVIKLIDEQYKRESKRVTPIIRKIFDILNKIFEKPKDFLLRYSQAFNFVYKDRLRFLAIKDESYTGDVFVFSNKKNKIIDYAFSTECEILKLFVSFFKEKNIDYVFFYIPARIEIENKSIAATFNQYYDLPLEEANFDRPIKEIKTCFVENSKEESSIFSLKDKFLEVKEGLYNTHGNHWSPKATNLTAKILKEELQKRNFT
ncbi:SGNH/GDSL hydrolase family protein [Candidatus Woesearchaeota archaeon]|nr:SGNH/GDSL hydrolase family protein [Candidatus Woesearchaeota archaeon]